MGKGAKILKRHARQLSRYGQEARARRRKERICRKLEAQILAKYMPCKADELLKAIREAYDRMKDADEAVICANVAAQIGKTLASLSGRPVPAPKVEVQGDTVYLTASYVAPQPVEHINLTIQVED